MNPLLAVDALTVGHGPLVALHAMSLEIAPGEIVALVGGNGAGKSTLLKAVMGLIPVQSGSIRFDSEAIDALPPWARARRGLGYCPEGRRVFAGLTVEENLDVVAHRDAKVDGVYKLFPALALRRNALGWQLSGGEQQMLAVGRALMAKPRLLLLDEPSLGLSPRLTGELLNRLRAIAHQGTAVLLAEQNAAPALAIADRAYVLGLGRVVDHGPASEPRLRQSAQAAFLS